MLCLIFFTAGCRQEKEEDFPDGHSVSGYLYDLGGNGLEDIDIVVTLDNGESRVTRTNTDGSWQIDGLFGEITVQPRHTSYIFSPSSFSSMLDGDITDIVFDAIEFYDDFSDPDSGWSFYDSKQIPLVKRSYVDGKCEIYREVGEPHLGGYSIIPTPCHSSLPSKFVYEADYQCLTGHGYYGLFLYSFKSKYGFFIDPIEKAYKVSFESKVDEDWIHSDLVKDGIHHLRIEGDGENVSYYLNDNLLYSTSIPNIQEIEEIRIGYGYFRKEKVSIIKITLDNFRLKKL